MASPVGGETHSGEQGGLPHPVSSKRPILRHINRTAKCFVSSFHAVLLVCAPFAALGTSPRLPRGSETNSEESAQGGQSCSSAAASVFTSWGIASSSIPA